MLKKGYPLTEEMEQLCHWSTVYSAADEHIDSRRAAFDAMNIHYSFPRDGSFLVEDGMLPNKNNVKFRIYKPISPPPKDGWPLVLYLHGGGLNRGGLDSHEFLTGDMAKSLNAWVFCLDYRLFPEYSYPAPLEDTVDAWNFIINNISSWNINSKKIVLSGDEIGAFLVATLTTKISTNKIQPAGMVLLAPCLTIADSFPSHQIHANAPQINPSDVTNYYENYISKEQKEKIKNQSLFLKENTKNLPKTWIGVTEWSPLVDEGITYFNLLRQQGIEVSLYEAKSIIHNSICMWRDCPNVYQFYINFLQAIRTMCA